ncbi:MAG TPA: hypothetical protein PKK91_05970, partial [bacterium]|nr:hypothetical protein [bacterium]
MIDVVFLGSKTGREKSRPVFFEQTTGSSLDRFRKNPPSLPFPLTHTLSPKGRGKKKVSSPQRGEDYDEGGVIEVKGDLEFFNFPLLQSPPLSSPLCKEGFRGDLDSLSSPFYKGGEGDLEIHPEPSFTKEGVKVLPLDKGGLRGIY